MIQKRSLKKKLFPGNWDITGGAVLAGESSREGAAREVQEELGLPFDPDSFVCLATNKGHNFFMDFS